MFSLLEREDDVKADESGQKRFAGVHGKKTHGNTFVAILTGIRIKTIAAHTAASFLASSPPIGNLAAKLPVGMRMKPSVQNAEKNVYKRRLLNRR